MTSLYQVTIRNKVVETITPKNKKVKRWLYIDIRKALGAPADREETIVGVPEDRVVRGEFGREVLRDLSSREKEYAQLMFPVTQVFDWDDWLLALIEQATGKAAYTGQAPEEGEDTKADPDAIEAEKTIKAA